MVTTHLQKLPMLLALAGGDCGTAPPCQAQDREVGLVVEATTENTVVFGLATNVCKNPPTAGISSVRILQDGRLGGLGGAGMSGMEGTPVDDFDTGPDLTLFDCNAALDQGGIGGAPLAQKVSSLLASQVDCSREHPILLCVQPTNGTQSFELIVTARIRTCGKLGGELSLFEVKDLLD